ncbi:MAGUK p55 subfamily member 5 [Brachionus plicatilis]|uniref:MAGUK p55 subfamily member 5 n=1 Tax=Brachionus plicatilis TaxID=10195 RepID=A0A3M7R6L6_BRAPC|nr:MAGUK p55 subfamily member 5 [Brachionus plicatilis]
MDIYTEGIELSHREMPVDCPDEFIPEIKTRPSLPNLIANHQNKSKKKSKKSLTKLSLSSNESSKSKNSSKNSDFSFSNMNSTHMPLLFNDSEHFHDRPPSYKSQNLYENDLLYLKEKNSTDSKGKVNGAFNSNDEDHVTDDKIKSSNGTIKSNKSNCNQKVNLNENDLKNLLLTCNNDRDLLTQILNSKEFCAKFDVRKSLISKSLKNILLGNETSVVTNEKIYENETILKSFEDGQLVQQSSERIYYSNTVQIEAAVNEKLDSMTKSIENEASSSVKKSNDSKLLLDDLVLNKNADDKIENEGSLTDEGKYLVKKAQYYCVDNLKLVNIEKSDDLPLGATIKNYDGSIMISRIVTGSSAHKSGLLRENDEILEINMIPVRGKTINDVCDMLYDLQGIISFLIIPNMNLEPTIQTPADQNIYKSQKVLHVRTLFNYSPQEDMYIPCRELGLSFTKGDILHITNQDDENWWQAYRDDDKEQEMAGLIPSQSFQEKRLSQMHAVIGDSFMNRKKREKGFCIKSNRRKFLYGLDVKNEDIFTYEEVCLYKPPTDRKRPIVLIGPHNIGRHELRKRLMQANPSLFEVAVPHTTRPQRKDEVDGKDYYFLPRHIFEVDIKQGRFIEHGEYEKNLYGTSRDAIRKVIESSKICILNLYPQAVKNLRNSDLMPYVIYIGPPNLIKLKELKMRMDESFRESDLLDIIDRGREIEELYGHYFDKIIRNCDMDKTYQELFEIINHVQNTENWIPTRWLSSL